MSTHAPTRIGGLGTLEVRKREARTGRNPATGDTMQIAASKKVAFRPAKELKEAAIDSLSPTSALT
jgi:DNA-binding protein HU-beta